MGAVWLLSTVTLHNFTVCFVLDKGWKYVPHGLYLADTSYHVRMQ